MAKKDSIGKEDLKSSAAFILPGSAFDDGDGETYAGLNILRLKAGEAGGPFVLKEILRNQKLGDNKNMKPVDVYVAEFNKIEIRMPAAASFVSKAKDSGLAAGDTFLVRRADDYIAKKFGKNNCAAYELKITARAGKKK